MALAVLLGLGLGACDQGAGDDNDTGEPTTTGVGDADGGPGDGPTCDLVPEVGPALLDFGRCEVMGSGRVIAACGNTGVHRRCDAAFLTWCNDQGGDVSACSEDQAIQAFGFVPCGTGPNAAVCDLPFKDNCDSLDGDLTCNTSDCTIGGCALPPIDPLPACSAQRPCAGGGFASCGSPDGGKVDAESCQSWVSDGVANVLCLWLIDGEWQKSGGSCNSNEPDTPPPPPEP